MMMMMMMMMTVMMMIEFLLGTSENFSLQVETVLLLDLLKLLMLFVGTLTYLYTKLSFLITFSNY
jgi:hypothetical protein